MNRVYPALSLSLLCALIAGCSAHIDATNPGVAPNAPNQSASSKTLKVGQAGVPETNEVDVGSGFAGTVVFTYQAPQDGMIDIEQGTSFAVNCDLSSAIPKVFVDSSSQQGREISLPTKIQVNKGESYAVRFVFPANSCEQISLTFTAAYDESVAPPPTQRPSPAQETGFLGESALPSIGGAIDLPRPTTDSVYRDYYFEVPSARAVYMNARSGSSTCSTTTALELLEIAGDGTIASRVDMPMGISRAVAAGKFYRLRWSAGGVKGCSYVFESFNVGWR